MADTTLTDLPTKTEFDSLPIPPADSNIFSDDLTLPANFLSFDDEDFDITFDDIFLPSDTDDFLNNSTILTDSDSNPIQLSSDPAISDPESNSRVLSCHSGDQGSDVAGFFNFPSPESGNQNPASSQGSGDCGSESLNCASPDSAHDSINEVVDQKINVQGLEFGGNVNENCLLKRKKDNGDVNSESRTSKYRRSNGSENSSQLNEEDERKKARLIRNRESAHLSRQRKKHYVEELEDKVRAMHSTIQDLNAKISYIVAENVSLRQQMVTGGGAVCPPPPHVMYPHPYPWMQMPCPPYVVKPQGSQVPLVPIPRLKPQPVSTPKSKKVEVKKTKKVAGVSFLGLLLFIMLFGGLVPMVNLRFGANSGGGSNYRSNRLYDEHRERVLTVNHHVNGTNHNMENDCRPNSLPGSDEFVGPGNASESLVASLYVPRNDKLVKIDGNLIIHSILASEKAMASHKGVTSSKETGLAVALDLAPAISIPVVGRNNGRHPHLYRTSTEGQRALKSDKENLKSKVDGKLQQWFREGLAGPMLSSGMCTEVFQFDISAATAPGAIVPATSVRNITAQDRQNSTYFNKGRNRRILHGLPIPLPGSANNITKEHVSSDSGNKENSHKNTSLSSMVVSVLVDPRESGDGDGDGVMGAKKSFSRIFVVVLLDSVKYVTYSCVLPMMGSSHLVTT